MLLTHGVGSCCFTVTHCSSILTNSALTWLRMAYGMHLGGSITSSTLRCVYMALSLDTDKPHKNAIVFRKH